MNSKSQANGTVTALHKQFLEYLHSIRETSGRVQQMFSEDIEQLYAEAVRIKESEKLAPLLHSQSKNLLQIITSRDIKEWIILAKHSSKPSSSYF